MPSLVAVFLLWYTMGVIVLPMWLYIALSGYFLLAVVSILDKFIVSEEKVAPSVVAFYSSAPLVLILLLVPFGVVRLHNATDVFLSLLSGGAFIAALWTMYKGFLASEVSHAGPLIGAAIPIFTILFGFIFSFEALKGHELFATGLLVLGSIIISFEQSSKNSGWHRGMIWVVVAGFFFALSNVAAKMIYDVYGFYSGLVWTRGAMGLLGLLFIFSPQVWRSFFSVRKKRIPIPKTKTRAGKIITVTVDKVLGVVGALLVQYAIALGSVSIVNALSGLQFAFLIILVALISKFIPKLFKEEYTRSEVLQEAVAVGIIGCGLALLIV